MTRALIGQADKRPVIHSAPNPVFRFGKGSRLNLSLKRARLIKREGGGGSAAELRPKSNLDDEISVNAANTRCPLVLAAAVPSLFSRVESLLLAGQVKQTARSAFYANWLITNTS